VSLRANAANWPAFALECVEIKGDVASENSLQFLRLLSLAALLLVDSIFRLRSQNSSLYACSCRWMLFPFRKSTALLLYNTNTHGKFALESRYLIHQKHYSSTSCIEENPHNIVLLQIEHRALDHLQDIHKK